MFISGHFHVLGMRKTRKYVFPVLRSKSSSGKCAKLHTIAASNNRDHLTRSLYYCLFASHKFGCCSLCTFSLWWITRSMQQQLRGCNNIPSFLQWTARIASSFCEGRTQCFLSRFWASKWHPKILQWHPKFWKPRYGFVLYWSKTIWGKHVFLHVAIATDGYNVIDPHNFLAQTLEAKIVSLVSVHRHAHRFT